VPNILNLKSEEVNSLSPILSVPNILNLKSEEVNSLSYTGWNGSRRVTIILLWL